MTGHFDYFGKLIRRGWLLLTQYRLLWVRGFIFALSTELSGRVVPAAEDEVMSAGEVTWVCLTLVLALFFFLIGTIAYLGLIAATDQIVSTGLVPSLSTILRPLLYRDQSLPSPLPGHRAPSMSPPVPWFSFHIRNLILLIPAA
jgi:hypothetical protein